jgi:hypothetical protein
MSGLKSIFGDEIAGDCGLTFIRSELFYLRDILKEKMYSNYAIAADVLKKFRM